MKISGLRETAQWGTVQCRHGISGLKAPVGTTLGAVRQHWTIENFLHCTLEVRFREEQRQYWKDHAPQPPASLRKIFHNLPKKEFSLKTGAQGKRLNAARRDDYLLEVLLG